MSGSDDLSRALGRVVMSDAADPPLLSGPMTSPVDRFAHLPTDTRRWLEGLRDDEIGRLKKLSRFSDDDIADLQGAMEFQRAARTIGRFGKWVLITVVSTFIGAVVLGEKIAIAWKWITGVPR